MTIEQVLAVRRKQCVGMADNMLSGLNKMLSELFRGLPIVQANTCRELLLKVMEAHRAVINDVEFAWFNDDENFRFSLNTTLDLNGALRNIASGVRNASDAFAGGDDGIATSSETLDELLKYIGAEDLALL